LVQKKPGKLLRRLFKESEQNQEPRTKLLYYY